MMRLFYDLVNTACCLLYRKAYRHYIRCGDIRRAQEELLAGILAQNRDTAFGKAHHFSKITTPKQFRAQVPEMDYEDYLPWITRAADGEARVLTAEPVRMFEKTSGSTAASKLVPYTDSLKQQFQQGIKPWIYDLYTKCPQVRRGQSYWSVTPLTAGREVTKGGIPIGFEEDSEYFGKVEQYLMNLVFVSPHGIAHETDINRFYMRTVLALLNAKHLTLISVWNPTFLMLLLDYLEVHPQELLKQLPSRRRREIENAVQEKDYRRIWKRLAVISCWADGNARADAEKLKAMFPGVLIQPKGLLATEGFVSFPLVGEDGAGLSYHSHYFEFRSLADGEFYPANQLEQGERYEVLLTTGGGFYRYRLKDVIAVCGHRGKVPLVRFDGKCDRVSDLYGEKLHEQFVAGILREMFADAEFCLLAPQGNGYVLYVKTEGPFSAEELDHRLRENFHYDYCRKLGQLNRVRCYRLTGNPSEEYIRRCQQDGQRLGDIKQAVLSLKQDWAHYLSGQWAD